MHALRTGKIGLARSPARAGVAVMTPSVWLPPMIQRPEGENANSRGVGQAKAVLFFVLVAVIALIQFSATRRKEIQQ